MRDITSILDDIEKKLLKEHWSGYYNWVRQIVSLSAGALTLTISLQKLYIPDKPSGLWLLQFSWLCLILSLYLGLLVLYGEVQVPLDNLNELRQLRAQNGDRETGISILEFPFFKVRSIYRIAYLLMASSFSLALLLLSLFAIFNVLKVP